MFLQARLPRAARLSQSASLAEPNSEHPEQHPHASLVMLQTGVLQQHPCMVHILHAGRTRADATLLCALFWVPLTSLRAGAGAVPRTPGCPSGG